MTAPLDPAVLESAVLFGDLCDIAFRLRNELPLPGDPDYDDIPQTGPRARADAFVIMGVVREHFGLSPDF